MTWPLRRPMKRWGSRLISSEREKRSSSRVRENCWLSITCRRRLPTAIKNLLPGLSDPDLKEPAGNPRRSRKFTLVRHEQKTRARDGYDGSRHVLLLRPPAQPSTRGASARDIRPHCRDVRDVPPHAFEHDGCGER